MIGEKIIEQQNYQEVSEFIKFVDDIQQAHSEAIQYDLNSFNQSQFFYETSMPTLNQQCQKFIDQNDLRLFRSYENAENKKSQVNRHLRISQSACFKQNKESQFQRQDQEQSSSNFTPKRTSKKMKKQRKQPYPTKNFLPVIRRILLNYLLKVCKLEDNHPKIKELIIKKSPNLNEFENLFNAVQLRPYFKKYFRSRMIYRDLMLFRGGFKFKKVYISKVPVIENAFETREFRKIN